MVFWVYSTYLSLALIVQFLNLTYVYRVNFILHTHVNFLHTGVTSPLYSLAAINAIVFGVQGNVLRRMENPDSLTSHFVAGASAGQ